MNHKIKRCFETVLYLFPLFMALLTVFRTGTFELATISDTIFNLVETPFIEPIYDWFSTNILGNVNNLYFNIAFGYISYAFFVTLVLFMFDVLMFVINWIRRWFNGNFC